MCPSHLFVWHIGPVEWCGDFVIVSEASLVPVKIFCSLHRSQCLTLIRLKRRKKSGLCLFSFFPFSSPLFSLCACTCLVYVFQGRGLSNKLFAPMVEPFPYNMHLTLSRGYPVNGCYSTTHRQRERERERRQFLCEG